MFALQEYDTRPTSDQGVGEVEQAGERRESAGDERPGGTRGHVLDALVVDDHVESQGIRGLPQERALLALALDELDAGDSEDREHDPREARAAAEIHDGQAPTSAPRRRWKGRTREQRRDLRGVEHVPVPYVSARVAADEIDALVLVEDEVDEALESRQRFT
jgi:hypothetical protein